MNDIISNYGKSVKKEGFLNDALQKNRDITGIVMNHKGASNVKNFGPFETYLMGLAGENREKFMEACNNEIPNFCKHNTSEDIVSFALSGDMLFPQKNNTISNDYRKILIEKLYEYSIVKTEIKTQELKGDIEFYLNDDFLSESVLSALNFANAVFLTFPEKLVPDFQNNEFVIVFDLDNNDLRSLHRIVDKGLYTQKTNEDGRFDISFNSQISNFLITKKYLTKDSGLQKNYLENFAKKILQKYGNITGSELLHYEDDQFYIHGLLIRSDTPIDFIQAIDELNILHIETKVENYHLNTKQQTIQNYILKKVKSYYK